MQRPYVMLFRDIPTTRKGLSRNPRTNDIGFINCYLDGNHVAPIKITPHHFFYELGSTFEDCVKRFLFY